MTQVELQQAHADPFAEARTTREQWRQVADVLNEARSWIGTPFVHQAAVKGQGVDCVQFLIAVYRATGWLPADFEHRAYVRGWFLRDARYLQLLTPYTVPQEGPPQPADIAMFSNRLPSGRLTKFPCHAAIVVEFPRVVHADPELGVVEVADCSRGMPGPFVCALQPRVLAGASRCS